MYREIRRKKAILENRMPLLPDVLREISEIGLRDMIYTNLRLSGSKLSREDINSILAGSVVREATVNEHVMINRYITLKKEMDGMLEMRDALTLRTLRRLYGIVMDADPNEDIYRKNNPTIYELSYNPPHFHDVPEQMEILMKWMGKEQDSESGNELLKAAHFHNRLIEVFPFENGNREMARIGLYYYMMRNGYPVFTFNISEAEYNTAIAAYIRKEDIGPLYSSLERSLYNKMDQLLMLTLNDNE